MFFRQSGTKQIESIPGPPADPAQGYPNPGTYFEGLHLGGLRPPKPRNLGPNPLKFVKLDPTFWSSRLVEILALALPQQILVLAEIRHGKLTMVLGVAPPPPRNRELAILFYFDWRMGDCDWDFFF